MADVAVLGTGRMGSAMAVRLAAAGHQLTVWDRTPAKAEALAERLGNAVRVASHPAQAVAGREVVLSTLADGDVTCAVVLDNQVLASLADGVVVCDLATSGIDAARALARRLADHGRSFVDAPVSGSVPTVLAGELLVMASGQASDVDRVRGVLGAFARRIIYVGPAGAGQSMKMSVNLVVHGLNAVVSESLQLAEMLGIARGDAYDVLEESIVASPFVTYKRSSFLDPHHPVAMSLEMVRKDLRLITTLAARVGSPASVTSSVASALADACERGMGASDMAALSRVATGSGSWYAGRGPI